MNLFLQNPNHYKKIKYYETWWLESFKIRNVDRLTYSKKELNIL